jgi:large subunit ribosomal protein L28
MLTFAPFPTASRSVAVAPAPGPPTRKWHMAAVCELCGKKPSFGMSLSHSHRRNKRRWNPNVQRKRVLVDGVARRVHVCTSCIRAGKIVSPPRRTYRAG